VVAAKFPVGAKPTRASYDFSEAMISRAVGAAADAGGAARWAVVAAAQATVRSAVKASSDTAEPETLARRPRFIVIERSLT
jgi:hypothetical protein